MGSYKKKVLSEQKNISGQVRDFSQNIDVVFYEKDENLPSKIAEYMYWLDEGGSQKKAIRSTYFSSVEQLKAHIKNLSYALGYFMRKRGKFGEFWKKQIGNISNDVYQSILRGSKKAFGDAHNNR